MQFFHRIFFPFKVENVEAIYFDGKKTTTLSQVESVTGSLKRKNVKKEHVVLIKEPNNEFISYVTPETGNSDNTANAIVNKLKIMNIPSKNIKLVGADGCNVNVGYKNGIIRKLEEKFNKPLQRAVCLLHLVELPLKKLFESLYGNTKGPQDYGELTDTLKNCQNMPVVKFEIICPANFPQISIQNLSSDQKYLFEMGLAIKNGSLSDQLASHTPGPMNHARWLTFAARILRTYVAQEKPDKKLVILAKFIMSVYIPFWHLVKTQNSISYAAQHFLGLIQMTRYS